LASLAIWISTTLYLYAAVLRRIVPDSLIYLLAIAFPGALQNILHGQNGFLTASLLGWGLLLLQGNPLAGGLILGLLSYKPHLAILVFVALVAGRYWKALGGAFVSAALLAVSSILFFDLDLWLAFKQQMPFVTSLIETGYLPWAKLSTIFALGMLLNIGVKASYAIQGVFTVVITLAVFWVWYKKNLSLSLKIPFLVASIFLITPYAFQYDLAILALAMAWYGWEAHTHGWKPYEKLTLLIMWIMPLFNDPLAKLVNIQIVPIVLLVFLALVLRRILSAIEKDNAAGSMSI
ncbi:MAG TPA: glycosyltransferase family 87 protein, partial [Desulfobacteria bacterium]|nr:glycosyltransferase family 87 protein [Desulfobacteria bacterium]